VFIAPFFSLQELCFLAYSLCLLNSQCIKLTTILTAIRTDLSGHDVSTGLLVCSGVIWNGNAMPLQHYYYTALFLWYTRCTLLLCNVLLPQCFHLLYHCHRHQRSKLHFWTALLFTLRSLFYFFSFLLFL